MEKRVNSHIQIPASIIKSFAHKAYDEQDKLCNAIYMIRCGSDRISEVKFNQYGTELDHYSEKTEDRLDREFESPLGIVRKKVKQFIDKSNFNGYFTEDEFNTLKKYLRMLLLRNLYFYKTIKSNMEHQYHFTFSHDAHLNLCLDANIEPIKNFDQYQVAVLVSKNKLFINSFSGLSYFIDKKISNFMMFFVPLYPTFGILYYIPKNKNGEVLELYANDMYVQNINSYMLLTEMEYSNHSIFGKRKEELLEVIKQ